MQLLPQSIRLHPVLSLTGAGSGVGFSLGLGTAYVDVGCEMREVVRLGLMSGNAAVNAKANEVLSTELDKYLQQLKRLRLSQLMKIIPRMILSLSRSLS